jgi:hypothetical protein
MPGQEKLVFDGLFRHLHAGDKSVNKEGWAYIDGHWKDPRLRAAMIWEAEHRDRNKRQELLHGYQSGASKHSIHLHTLPQIVVMCKQLLALLPRYA